MSNVIYGNMVGGGAAPLKTLILTDENGNEFFGVVTDSEQILTANASTDIREGTVAVTDEGIVTGSTFIPNYNTSEGYRIIRAGNEFKLVLSASDLYDYSKLQCIICPFNSSASNSVSAEKVVIEDNVYEVNSNTSISVVEKDINTKSIDFGIINNSASSYLIRYFTYKEIV